MGGILDCGLLPYSPLAINVKKIARALSQEQMAGLSPLMFKA